MYLLDNSITKIKTSIQLFLSDVRKADVICFAHDSISHTYTFTKIGKEKQQTPASVYKAY